MPRNASNRRGSILIALLTIAYIWFLAGTLTALVAESFNRLPRFIEDNELLTWAFFVGGPIMLMAAGIALHLERKQ